ncbi:heme-binding protein [Musa troglodytarum]|uniref:Heme-binding protein n=1 Tax=Musa troglodytarum TaxID=320322 RepID=A0A9E7KHH2_9LILI|nr:heme-binding protein [Musa troglodytarum]
MNRSRGFTLLAVVPLSLVVAGAIESPQYTVVHSESDSRLFQYIQGANLNSSRIRMIARLNKHCSRR